MRRHGFYDPVVTRAVEVGESLGGFLLISGHTILILFVARKIERHETPAGGRRYLLERSTAAAKSDDQHLRSARAYSFDDLAHVFDGRLEVDALPGIVDA